MYVDGIVVIGNDAATTSSLNAFLDDKFKITDLGELNFFLGMEILKVSNGLIMTQRKFST